MNRKQIERAALEALKLSGYQSRTVNSYYHWIGRFLRDSRRPIAQLTMRDVKAFLLHLKEERDLAGSTVNQALFAIKLLYVEVLSRPWESCGVRCQKRAKKLPVILSRLEVRRLFEATADFKYRTILRTTYSAGLRLGEVIHLQPKDIDSDGMQIHIRSGKGAKDRMVMLSESLLEELRQYWKKYRPVKWLFPGKDPAKPVDSRSVQRAFARSATQAGMTNRVAGNETRTTRLEVMEFLRRFLQHVLPSGFHRIRYSGWWANRVRAANLERCRLLLGVVAETPCVVDREGGDDQESWAEKVERLTGVDPLECPVCRQGRLVYLAAVARTAGGGARDPPSEAS